MTNPASGGAAVGRRVAAPTFESRVRSLRLLHGLSQRELARRVALTRQAVGAIEGGDYVPNTLVALRLARALRCRVEDLFVVPDRGTAASVDLVGPSAPGARRLTLAHVRGRWVGYPLAAGTEVAEGFVSADGLLADERPGPSAELLVAPQHLQRTALVLGCDPGLAILGAHLTRRASDVALRWLGASSQAALTAVSRGEAHIAGSHLRDPDSGAYNVPQARRALAGAGGLVIAFARWELGLILGPGNPKAIRTVADLTRPDVRLVNRPAGSGSRLLLDELLDQSRTPVDAIGGYDRVVTSHLAVARAVSTGGADVGIGLLATARAHGLDFAPLADAQFDLVIARDHLEHPAVALVCELLQSRELRAELALLPGYEVSRMGTVVADVAA